jgi:hypothetical protein
VAQHQVRFRGRQLPSQACKSGFASGLISQSSTNSVEDYKTQLDKKDETIQRLATPEEDKQTSTNDERMKQDKDKQS